jgi:hypothetical protein
MSLATIGRRYWPFFAAAWVFPIAFLALFTLVPRVAESPLAPLVWMPAFFISFGLACIPGILGWIKQRYVIFWGILVPFMVWTIAVIVHLAVLKAIGG